jgi:hypothetical protein
MSPSTNQVGTDSNEYDTEAERIIATKPKGVILSIHPQNEENAREWLGAANGSGDRELVEHFAKQVQQCKDD